MRQRTQSMLDQARSDAERFIATAQQKASSILADADQYALSRTSAADKEATETLTAAKEKARTLKDESQAVLTSATAQAAKILAAAEAKAQEIAGNAYEALKNASLYQKTVKALKNTIEGYGNQYIIPQQSLLDDLAEDFSHEQAGRELKRARDCTKMMIQNGTAATCDYVDANRSETAISFVIDAFNGKVDSILSRVKHDNAGKLAQQIRDACALVNFNGKAFREARISEEFLAARLDELKWAAIAQQLALQEREQQREIKEQVREEARAARELERALREAAKEEAILQKAMEQAREQFERASGEQRSMYEARLQEMSVRLNEAMERKDRARSMAEQTKRGHVYIISNLGSFGEDVYKIGLTRRWDPMERVNELGGASVPFAFDVHAIIMSDDAPTLERKLHQLFVMEQVNKANPRKEFFRVPLSEIREAIEGMGLDGVAWTMTAAAKEYRESLATEKLLQDSPAEREKWLSRQRRLECIPTDEMDLVGALADDE